MAVWEFVQLVVTVTVTFTYSSAFQSCGNLTFLHHVSLDGQMFNDTFITEHSVTDKATCLSMCFHELQCNMVLYNPTSQGCRLYYSCSITGGEQEAGWQYYAVPCTEFRVLNAVSMLVRNQSHVDVTCPSGFSYLPTTSDTCFHDNVPVNVGRCMQTLWVDQVPVFSTPLPAPLSSGTEIIVEAAGDGAARSVVRLSANESSRVVFLLVVRWSISEIIYNTARILSQWEKEISSPDFLFTPNVTSNLSIKITNNEFQMSVDDKSLLDAPVRIPLHEAITLDVDFSLIKRVQIKYPKSKNAI
ncbi:uncharacterized protein [Haliotis cracherodii]|uniref:uncharacterized protein n=1 Tax=Haliotis cracherodii TaxID=6455 RepID=UPI0039EA9235